MIAPVPSLRTRARRGTVVSLLGLGGTQMLRLLSNLVLARLLFPEAFALMAIVYLVMFALDQFSNVGVGAAILRYDRGEEPEFLDTAWTLQVIRGLGLWAIATALTPWVADFYNLPELRSILPVAALQAVLAGLVSTKIVVLNRRLEPRRIVAIELSGQATALVVMVITALLFRSVWALVIGGLANQVVITILSHIAIPGHRNRFRWQSEDARSIYSIGKWVLASSGISFLLAQIDIALLGRLVPPALLGVYSLGAIIPNLLRDVSFRLSSTVLAPVVAESNRNEPETLHERYAAARRLTLPATLLAAAAAATIAPAFFEFLYDERYRDAGWICQLALLRFWFAYLQVTSCMTLLSIGDGRTWTVSNVIGLAGSVTGCLLGFEIAGLPGLLVGMALGTAMGAVLPIVNLSRRGIASPMPEIRFTAFGVLLTAVVLFVVRSSEEFVPIEHGALRTLVVGGIALAPFAVWVAFRVLPEMVRASTVGSHAPTAAGG